MSHKFIKSCHTFPVLQCFLPFNITLPAIFSPFYSFSSTFFSPTFFVLSFTILLTYSSPEDKIKIKKHLKKCLKESHCHHQNSYTYFVCTAMPLPTAVRSGSVLHFTCHGRTSIPAESFCVQQCGPYPHLLGRHLPALGHC